MRMGASSKLREALPACLLVSSSLRGCTHRMDERFRYFVAARGAR